MDARAANDRVAGLAQRLQFVSRVPMLCECSGDCTALVMIGLDDYHALRDDADSFLTAPGHVLEGGEPAERGAGYWVQRRAHQAEERASDGA